jgi:hypothetical protein
MLRGGAMKTALYLFAGLAIAALPLESRASLLNPWHVWDHIFGGPCYHDGHSPRGGYHINPDGTQGGFVAEGADVSDGAYIQRGAQVCGGQVGEGAVLGSDARIEGEASITGRSYVNADVRGHVTIVDSRVTTSSQLVAFRPGISGEIVIYGSTVEGNAKVAAGTDLFGVRAVNGFESSGGEFCNINNMVLTGRYPHGVYGKNCDGPPGGADGSRERQGYQYSYSWQQRAVWNDNYSTQGYYGNCSTTTYDQYRQVYACGGGASASAYQAYSGIQSGFYYDASGGRFQRMPDGALMRVSREMDEWARRSGTTAEAYYIDRMRQFAQQQQQQQYPPYYYQAGTPAQ